MKYNNSNYELIQAFQQMALSDCDKPFEMYLNVCNKYVHKHYEEYQEAYKSNKLEDFLSKQAKVICKFTGIHLEKRNKNYLPSFLRDQA